MDESVLNNSLCSDTMTLPTVSYKMVVLRGLLVFPGQSLHFDLGRDKSMVALTRALENNEDVFLVMQKNANNNNPAPQDIYRIGVLCKIKQTIKMPNESIRVLVTGFKRMEIVKYIAIAPHFEVSLKEYDYFEEDKRNIDIIKELLDVQYQKYKKLDPRSGDEAFKSVSLEDTDKFITNMSFLVYKNDAEKQSLLQLRTRYDQLENIYAKLVSECDILAIQKKISNKVRESVDKNQKDYYLREQIKAIKSELGEDTDELAEYRERAKNKNLPTEVFEKLEKEISRMEKMSPTSPEAGVSRTYIEWILDLPWSEQSADNADLEKAKQILDEDHYGLEKVKQRIIEYLAVHELTHSLKSPILCFVGPPGVGKTSIVSSIARSIGRQLVTMSLGGVRDEAEIRGHRRTYIGALPGRIVSGMKQAKVINPVFLLDEIDKMSSDFRGDPASAMLEVLDPNQNSEFKDHYLEMPYDLSKIMFVTTANTLDTIPSPLLDRMEVIELSGYTYEEKLEIAKRYLLPKQLKAAGLEEVGVNIGDDVIMEVISKYTRESGVRNLERELGTVARKLAVKLVNSGKTLKEFAVSVKDLNEYLGTLKYRPDEINEASEVGLATGLAWTSVGGVTLSIEVALIPDGKGDIKLTGSLGEVMKESCHAALSYIRSRYKEYGIEEDYFSKYDIHIHVPEGATPKDGPSAGITMATALLSALSGKKVNKNVAMTGEITLRGKVMPIGGLKEKSLAAMRSGIKTLIIPFDNLKDLEDIPAEVKSHVDIYPVKTIDEVFKIALENYSHDH